MCIRNFSKIFHLVEKSTAIFIFSNVLLGHCLGQRKVALGKRIGWFCRSFSKVLLGHCLGQRMVALV